MDRVTLQTDVGNVPTNALQVLSAAQPLLKALSSDNIHPLALIEAQSLGGCFHSNGEWASKSPDLLARTSSVRLERLAAWVGWQKGDTGSIVAQSSSGRTISLICLALTNLYPKEKCGLTLKDGNCRKPGIAQAPTSRGPASARTPASQGRYANEGAARLGKRRDHRRPRPELRWP